MTAVRSAGRRMVARTFRMVLHRLKGVKGGPRAGLDSPIEMIEDSRFFSSLFSEQADESRPAVTWQARQAGIRAVPLDLHQGARLFAGLWKANRLAAALAPSGVAILSRYLHFVQVPPGQEVIGQGEQGDYVLLVLAGRIGVDRLHAGGRRSRLAEAGPGDLSFLAAGTRGAACCTLQPTTLAVLEAARLDDLMRDQPHLASVFVAFLARHLSLRLRQASARLSVRMEHRI
jgi:CRP/FNR family cyclic AMP-dependent transcriptional regulator